jgi:hypothetical protein
VVALTQLAATTVEAPKRHDSASPASNSCPDTVTAVPPPEGPRAGSKDATAGGAAQLKKSPAVFKEDDNDDEKGVAVVDRVLEATKSMPLTETSSACRP